jgi:NAD(P)-dependent dehydrogenase (short-subunit alcohol dehydrogenase family)
MELETSSIVITGASRGLGRALALELGARGARLVLVARDGARLAAVAREALGAGAAEAHAVVGDVGDKYAVHRIAGSAQALAGPVDVLVHNASTLGPSPLALLLDTECEDLARALEVNVVGPFRLSKALAGSMALRGAGVLVHVSSDAAVEAYPRWGAYGLSKAALDHLARTFAAELDGTGVRSFAVDPGEMDTDMHREAIPDADPSDLAMPREVARRIARMIEDESIGRNGARVRAADVKVPS